MNTSDNDNISGMREIIAELNRQRAEMLQALRIAKATVERLTVLRHGFSSTSATIQIIDAAIARAKKQRGSILPELLMLGAILFTLVFGGIHYARKSDAAVERWAAAQGWRP